MGLPLVRNTIGRTRPKIGLNPLRIQVPPFAPILAARLRRSPTIPDTKLRDPHAPQASFGNGLLHGAVRPNSVHELVDGGKRRSGPLAHSDRHLHDVEASGQHACAG